LGDKPTRVQFSSDVGGSFSPLLMNWCCSHTWCLGHEYFIFWSAIRSYSNLNLVKTVCNEIDTALGHNCLISHLVRSSRIRLPVKEAERRRSQGGVGHRSRWRRSSSVGAGGGGRPTLAANGGARRRAGDGRWRTSVVVGWRQAQ
jgi:hypothetical protein